MYKLVAITAMMTVWLLAHLLQVEEEVAMKTLSQGKRAVNRAVHAAAQQLDREALGDGLLRLDEAAAAEAAMIYLQANLQLDGAGAPLPGSFLKEAVEVLEFEVVNADRVFPYHYRNEAYDYEAVLRRPGVVMIVRLVHPRTFAVMEPIEWTIRGAAELVS